MAGKRCGSAVDLTTVNAKVEKLLDCPVCFWFMDGHIFMCMAGHPVCEACKNTLQWQGGCHTCKKPFVQSRVLGLEHISEVVYRQCESNGCDSLFTTASKNEHFLECIWRPASCLLCNWIGNLFTIGDHVATVHQVKPELKFAPDASITVRESVNSLRQHDQSSITYAVDSFDRVFAFRLHNKAGCVWFCAALYATKDNANQFRIQVEITPQNDNGSEFRIVTDIHSDLERQDGLCVPLTSVQGMEMAGWVDQENKITISCRIFERSSLVAPLSLSLSPTPSSSSEAPAQPSSPSAYFQRSLSFAGDLSSSPDNNGWVPDFNQVQTPDYFPTSSYSQFSNSGTTTSTPSFSQAPGQQPPQSQVTNQTPPSANSLSTREAGDHRPIRPVYSYRDLQNINLQLGTNSHEVNDRPVLSYQDLRNICFQLRTNSYNTGRQPFQLIRPISESARRNPQSTCPRRGILPSTDSTPTSNWTPNSSVPHTSFASSQASSLNAPIATQISQRASSSATNAAAASSSSDSMLRAQLQRLDWDLYQYGITSPSDRDFSAPDGHRNIITSQHAATSSIASYGNGVSRSAQRCRSAAEVSAPLTAAAAPLPRFSSTVTTSRPTIALLPRNSSAAAPPSLSAAALLPRIASAATSSRPTMSDISTLLQLRSRTISSLWTRCSFTATDHRAVSQSNRIPLRTDGGARRTDGSARRAPFRVVP